MRPIDTGCSPESNVFFYTPGDQARRTFFYPLCAGHYYCNSSYRVQRNNYDSFLIIYVKKGAGYLTIQNKTFPFQSGDLVIVDCYQPHIYGTTTDSEILWIHFDGATSREYIQMLQSQNEPVYALKNALSMENELKKVINMISSQENINDPLCSLSILQLLTEAMLGNDSRDIKKHPSHVIEDTLSYISSHIGDSLSLQFLADRAGLSPFYFTRLFKKETGYTPHNYIIQSRINIAKFYLKSSEYSIKQICFNSGFPSESSFCSTFKKISGMTPSEYKAENHKS
jgi:AraC-like DNA-binding protein